MSNDLNEIKLYDDAVDNRVRVINYPKVFVDRVSQNELELRMDPQLCEEMNTDEFKFCFVMLNIERIFEHCIENEPDDDKKGKEDWVGSKEDTDYVCRFLNEYEMTGNQDDWIESHKIIEWLAINNIGISMTKWEWN